MSSPATNELTALSEAKRGAYSLWNPPPKLTVSGWADKFRRLSTIDSAEPGQWDTARAEYQRGMMDAFNDPTWDTVVFMTSAQVGKTQGLNNIIGYIIDQDPGPVMMVQPTAEDAKEWSKDRFMEAMVNVTPCLRGKVQDAKTGKGSESTIQHKKFPGGQLTVAWSNSPSRLASRPIRVVLMDEIDKYKIEPRQGDPIERAMKRTATFWNRKHVIVSTPTLKDFSAIEKWYDKSDQRRYYVPCPECGEFGVVGFFEDDDAQFFLSWPKERNSRGEVAKHDYEKAHLACKKCGAAIEESQKDDLVSKGKWVAENPGGKIAGFQLNELISPWSSWSGIAKKFIDAVNDVEALRIFYNETLGRTWELKGEALSDSALMRRREKYPEGVDVPMGVAVLVAGGDVQSSPPRVEIKVKGYGPRGRESWDIAYRVFHGDPALPQVWQEVDEFLASKFKHESGVEMGISATFIDSAGHHTQHVYQFCKARYGRRIFPVIGRSSAVHIATKPGKPKNGVHLWTVGTDIAKEYIYRHLRIPPPENGQAPQPGYCHFRESEEYDQEYFAQLTAEKLVIISKAYNAKKEWVKIRDRNEALDTEVYALAALEAFKYDLVKGHASLLAKAHKLEHPPEPEPVIAGAPQPEVQKPSVPKRRPVYRNTFVTRW
jgi:phage terminase large subunit GpA-like protein